MDIGIGLPSNVLGASGSAILDWARRAEERSFSSLSVIDALVAANYEPLITLAAAAGATSRIRLMTAVVLAPLRNSGVFAKEVASLDAISNGRLVLGLGVGRVEEEYRAAPALFSDRGKRFEEQLMLMKRVWRGEPVGDGVGAIGPMPARPGGPEILIGAYTPVALRRVGRFADGFISGGHPPAESKQTYDIAVQSWKDVGRSGKPRFVGSTYFCLGPHAKEGIRKLVDHYYGFLGPKLDDFLKTIPSTEAELAAVKKGFEDVGADELTCWPCLAELDQVDRLADLALK